MNPVYLIDHSNFRYRFKSVHRYAQTSISGVIYDYSVLQGYINALRHCPFSDIIIVLDGYPKWVKDIYPEYKGTRNHDINDNVLSVSLLEEVQFLTKLSSILNKNIRVVCSPMQEADQVISSIVHIVVNGLTTRYKFISSMQTFSIESDKFLNYLNSNVITHSLDLSLYNSVVIASTDADMQQLQVYKNVFIDSSMTGRKVSTVKTSDSVASLPPASIPIYKAIYGDVSDNIPPIQLKASKKEMYSLISKVSTREEVIAIRSAVSTGKSTSSPIVDSIVSKVLSESKSAEFLLNMRITLLDFFSIPLVIEYPNYSIESTLNKYNLSV